MALLIMRNFESFRIGEKASLTHKVKHEDVEKFVDLSGDDNKIHVNRDFAKRTPFNKPVVHGMIGVSFISTLIGTKIPGDGALWFKQSVEFILPVRIGDVIEVSIEIIGIKEKSRSLELYTEIKNQHGQVVTKGISEVKVIELKSEKEKVVDVVTPCAVVIGGTGGIGSQVCLDLAKRGFDIAIHFFSNGEKAKEISKTVEQCGRRSVIISGDVSNEAEVKEMKFRIERAIGVVTHVINCSTSPTPNIKFANVTWEKFTDHYNVNVRGAFNLVKLFAPLMIDRRHGCFIFISTQYTDSPKTELSYYISAKAALEGLVRSLAVEYGHASIRFNLVSPGMTETELISDVPEKVKLLSALNTPLRRLGLAEDVSNAVCFLASDQAGYVTGETLRVNGGQVMF
jgi:3-oxoacyl-[acyl-carrier protein] reductase